LVKGKFSKKLKALQKTECKKVAKSQSYAQLIFGRHLGSDKKNLMKPKNRAQNNLKITELWWKTQLFSHYEIHRHFQNLYKNFTNLEK
jgi:uncharacterized protein YciW